MPTPIRWGILGPGHIAEKFAEALNHTAGVVLEAVASRDPARAAAFAGKYGCGRYFGDYISLAEDPSVDVIYIATPHGFHLEHALLCLERGKPLLIEKPLTLSGAETSKLTDTARQKNLFVMEAMWTRFLPVIRTAEKLIREGRIGDLRMVTADFCFRGTQNPEGRLYNMRLGGGSLLDVGVYPLSLFQLLLGNPEKILSTARLAAGGADETCQAILQYPGARSAQMISGISFDSPVTATISGTEGMIQIPARWYRAGALSLEPRGEARQAFSCPVAFNGFEYQIREVVRCLDEGVLESPDWPHSMVLDRFKTMDLIREQCGIRYD